MYGYGASVGTDAYVQKASIYDLETHPMDCRVVLTLRASAREAVPSVSMQLSFMLQKDRHK